MPEMEDRNCLAGLIAGIIDQKRRRGHLAYRPRFIVQGKSLRHRTQAKGLREELVAEPLRCNGIVLCYKFHDFL